MKKVTYLNEFGDFKVEQSNQTSDLYFPLANQAGMMSSITPSLGGDSKTGQHHFLLAPVTSETLHDSRSTRNVWCGLADGTAWSATGQSDWQRAQTFQNVETYTVEAGMLWHKLTVENPKLGLSSEITNVVAASTDQVEWMKIVITNTFDTPQTITPTMAIPMYARSADDVRDHRHVTSLLHRVMMDECTLSIQPTLSFDEQGHRVNKTIYRVACKREDGQNPIGYTPDVETYIGEGGSFTAPKSVILHQVPTHLAHQTSEGYESIAAMHFESLQLQPNESVTYILAMGIDCDVKADLTTNTFDALLEETKQYWQGQQLVNIKTGSTDFDHWMKWVGIQPTLRRIYGCSFLPHHDYGKGGRGWRDLWQDSLALLLSNPETVRADLISYCDGIRLDGTNATIIGNTPGSFLADRNNIVRVWMDHGIWPTRTIALYINQSGDASILLEQAAYFNDPQTMRGTRVNKEWKQRSTHVYLENNNRYQASILEHLLIQNVTAFYEVGEHNICRLRGADWNDGLDMAQQRGESVAFTSAYADNLSMLSKLIQALQPNEWQEEVSFMSPLVALIQQNPIIFASIEQKQAVLASYCEQCETYNGEQQSISKTKLCEQLEAMANFIRKQIQCNEWVEDDQANGWYNSYYDNDGQRVEGMVNNQVRMMLTGQVFTIMSNTATDAQVASIARAVDQYLFDEQVGGYRLNTKFNEVKTNLGRMFGFAYGHKENGAVFSHMSVMYAYALYSRGFVAEGYKALNTLYEQSARGNIYPGIPEYFNQKGRGMYHYLTGSASWYVLTLITKVFGVYGQQGDLVLEPKLMLEQFDQNKQCEITTNFRGKQVHVVYHNPEGLEYGTYIIKQVVCNGLLTQVNQKRFLLAFEELQEHTIHVTLGGE
ncbi:MAG: GH36-type glycosyl hydrolase domain-containing protein [Erysipelotrichaceae bacterium]